MLGSFSSHNQSDDGLPGICVLCPPRTGQDQPGSRCRLPGPGSSRPRSPAVGGLAGSTHVKTLPPVRGCSVPCLPASPCCVVRQTQQMAPRARVAPPQLRLSMENLPLFSSGWATIPPAGCVASRCHPPTPGLSPFPPSAQFALFWPPLAPVPWPVGRSGTSSSGKGLCFLTSLASPSAVERSPREALTDHCHPTPTTHALWLVRSLPVQERPL
jgi:hypothetical protein